MWEWKDYNTELYHFGIKGMNRGERRYQNDDGSLTPAGRVHYGVGEAITKTKGLASKIGSGLKSAGSKVKNEAGIAKTSLNILRKNSLLKRKGTLDGTRYERGKGSDNTREKVANYGHDRFTKGIADKMKGAKDTKTINNLLSSLGGMHAGTYGDSNFAMKDRINKLLDDAGYHPKFEFMPKR